MTKIEITDKELNFLDGPGYLPSYYDPEKDSLGKPATDEQIERAMARIFPTSEPAPETKGADRSGAPMLAHLEGTELEALLTLLQGMKEKEAAQARASLARELAGRKGGPGSGHEGHAGRLGEQGGSLPGAGASWAHHGGESSGPAPGRRGRAIRRDPR